MSDGPTLVHIEVDGPTEEVEEWHKMIQQYPHDNYEFIVSPKGDTESHTVVDRDALVEDIADRVVEKLEDSE